MKTVALPAVTQSAIWGIRRFMLTAGEGYSMAWRIPTTPHYVLAIVGPPAGFGLLLVNFVVSCGPVGYPPGESPPRGFRYVILEWQNIGIAYGNGCEITYHSIVLFGGIALVGAGLLSLSIIWKHTEQ